MPTTAPPRPQAPVAPMRRPAPGPAPASGTGFTPIDPIKLLHKYKWVLAASVVLGAVIGTGVHFAWLRLAPSYTSYSVFQVSGTKNDATLLSERVDENELERFMATQVQRMKSEAVLQKVVDHPIIESVASGWSSRFRTPSNAFDKVKARQDLEDIVNAHVIPGTQLIKLSVKGKTPAEITALARLVRLEYLRTLGVASRIAISKQIDALSAQIGGDTVSGGMKGEIDALKVARAKLLQESTGQGTSPQGTEVAVIGARTIEESTLLQRMNDQLTEVRLGIEAFETAQKRYEDDNKNTNGPAYDEELRAEVDQLPIIASLKQTVAMLQAQRLTLQNEGIRPDHQEWRRLEASLNGQQSQLDAQRALELTRLFGALIDSTRNTIEQLEAQEEDLIRRINQSKVRLDELTFTQTQLGDIDEEIRRISDSRNRLNDELGNLKTLKKQSTEGTVEQPLYIDRIEVIVEESPPDQVDWPKLKIMLPAGVLVFGGLAGMLVVLRELLDQRIKSPADVALIPRTRPLGMVPFVTSESSGAKAIETAFRDHPAGVIAESYRKLRGVVLTRMDEAGHHSLLIAGGMPSSGATSVAINLAFACAAADRKVLLIDANLRRPSMHRLLGLDESPGMADVLAGRAVLADAIQSIDTPNLDVLTVGSSDERVFERLATMAYAKMLAEVGDRYELILIDAAPAIVSGDAVAIANRCDASMLVVKAFGEKRGMVARLRGEFDAVRGEFLGVLVNAVRPAAGGYLKRNIRVAHQYQSASS